MQSPVVGGSTPSLSFQDSGLKASSSSFLLENHPALSHTHTHTHTHTCSHTHIHTHARTHTEESKK